ncbi:MAG: DNA-3-methyladenine glycosylase 2 family protein [Burkholderiales bacterium]|nr:DNA-3-methyladenine glycosylase 2 family protein [Burkholderiales bacterium]
MDECPRDCEGIVKPLYWDVAARALADGDRVLGRLIDAHPGIHLVRRGDPFTTLARAIVGQQISVKAAQSIWDRLVVATGGAGVPVAIDPVRVGRVRMSTLRRVGLSERKASYLRDLARHFRSGTLDSRDWPALADEALIERLVDVKGIGRWTAEMFLIFHELRPDIFPVGDIGLQKAVALHYHAGNRMPPAELRAFGERWAPYRSVATWYLWRSLDPIPVEY